MSIDLFSIHLINALLIILPAFMFESSMMFGITDYAMKSEKRHGSWSAQMVPN